MGETFDRVAEFYDFETTLVEDIPFYVEYAKKSGGPVLELGCGTGRALIPIAKAGIEIWGLDISKSMLEIAKKEVDTK
jgi:ubiquinone/menaquinone biosynthesis C-methylase UbiE